MWPNQGLQLFVKKYATLHSTKDFVIYGYGIPKGQRHLSKEIMEIRADGEGVSIVEPPRTENSGEGQFLKIRKQPSMESMDIF